MRSPRWAGLAAGLTLLLAVAAPQAAAQATEDAVQAPSTVSIVKDPDGSFKYLVDGQPQVFIGMGYNPIYRYMSDEDRASAYRRDFQTLRDAGVNTITGWDADKGYEQDKFDELTLSLADEYGIGVVMPLNLPPEGDYTDPRFVTGLLDEARDKIERFKDFHALRMWGVGNEVFWKMDPDMYPAFEDAYLQIADLFHQMDPNHPVIYREAEDAYVDDLAGALRDSGDMRPWLQYGMNVYNKDPGPLLKRWPSYGLDRPLFVSEFGTQGDSPQQRAQGYLAMWQSIRCYPDYVLGGAPYAWTTDGPEPTDPIWGLMDGSTEPVDGTFALLSHSWQTELQTGTPDCPASKPVYVPPSQPLPVPRPPAPIVRAPVVIPAPVVIAPPPAPPSPAPAPQTHHEAAVTTRHAPAPTPTPVPARNGSRPASKHKH